MCLYLVSVSGWFLWEPEMALNIFAPLLQLAGIYCSVGWAPRPWKLKQDKHILQPQFITKCIISYKCGYYCNEGDRNLSSVVCAKCTWLNGIHFQEQNSRAAHITHATGSISIVGTGSLIPRICRHHQPPPLQSPDFRAEFGGFPPLTMHLKCHGREVYWSSAGNWDQFS